MSNDASFIRNRNGCLPMHVGKGNDCGCNYLSAMLAGLTLSMMMTCLLQYMEVERARPRLEPMDLATSTSSGPEAVATESIKEEKDSDYIQKMDIIGVQSGL